MKRPPHPIVAGVERITPEIAQAMLTRNVGNRTFKPAAARKYLRAMRTGHFKSLNGEAIVFNWDGGLEDGQHRLTALIDSGLPFMDFLIVRGVAPKSNETMDQGAPRTVADGAAMRGFEDTRVLMAAVRWAWIYEKDWPGGLTHNPDLSAHELLEYLQENSHIAYANTEVRREYPRAHRLLMPSVATFVRVATDAVDPELSNEFFRALDTGQLSDASRQISGLRDKLLARSGRSHRMRPADIVVFAARVWNAMRAGRDIRVLVVGRDMGKHDQKNPYRNAPRFE